LLGNNETIHVYIVSDSIGETAELMVNAVVSQFNSASVEMHRETFLSDTERIKRIVQEASSQKSLITYTLVKTQLREVLAQEGQKYNIPMIDLMGPLLDVFSSLMSSEPRLEPGLIRRLDEDYYRRVTAVEFTVKHDDGKDPNGLLKGDIVLIGVSRTSKTPLSMYLAHKKLKVANMPLVPEVEPPHELFWVPAEKVMGLTIDPNLLREIRLERLNSMGLKTGNNYADTERIMEELEYARGIMRRVGCKIYDVSHKAVEEVAGKILYAVKESGKIWER